MTQTGFRKVGDIRPSHLIYGFGIGSLIDLPNFSAIVSGLDRWDVSSTTGAPRLYEPRLLKAVQGLLGPQVSELVHPPFREDEDDGIPYEGYHRADGVPVATFPRWLVCPQCRTLAPLEQFDCEVDRFKPTKTKYSHGTCQVANKPTAFPVRFLVTCKKGHLDDFPWQTFVHRGPSSCEGPYRFSEFSVTSEARDIFVECLAGCGVKPRPMLDAFGERGRTVLPRCTGRHPHLRCYEERPCTDDPKTILLGASNLWFPASVSILHVPRSSDEEENLIEEMSTHFSNVKSLDELATAISTLEQAVGFGAKLEPRLLDILAGQIPLTKIWSVLERVRREASQPLTRMELKPPEYQTFTRPDHAPKSRDFLIREARRDDSRLPPEVRRVVLVERLREVKALTGFTRLESPGELSEIDPEERPNYVRLANHRTSWVPAVEVRGEGFFVEFDENAIQQWMQRPAVQEVEARFLEAHTAWREERKIEPAEGSFPGMRMILLHSISHALMRQISLSSGYSAASIRERIYARDPAGDIPPMAGILLYTSAPDSEGTLGGLVRAGQPEELAQHFTFALEEASFCGSDPLCAEHEPTTDLCLHGAACHSCLLAPETSCEFSNRYLDRRVLARTLNSSTSLTDLNFFSIRK